VKRRGGHNLKSRQRKLIAGTWRADRDRSGLPASPGIPTAPAELTGRALEKWRELVARPGLRQVLSEHDGEALALLCVHWSTALEAYTLIAKQGILKRGYRKAPVKHPAFQVLRDSSNALGGLLARFGMTPADRARIDVPEVDDSDAFEVFLQRGKERRAGIVPLRPGVES
jgi:P27 family predicted phage terminase small subunit